MTDTSDTWESFLVGDDDIAIDTDILKDNLEPARYGSDAINAMKSNSEYDLLKHAADISLFSMEQGDIDDTLEYSAVMETEHDIDVPVADDIFDSYDMASPRHSKHGGRSKVDSSSEGYDDLTLSPIPSNEDIMDDQQLEVCTKDTSELFPIQDPQVTSPVNCSEGTTVAIDAESTWQSRLEDYKRTQESNGLNNGVKKGSKQSEAAAHELRWVPTAVVPRTAHTSSMSGLTGPVRVDEGKDSMWPTTGIRRPWSLQHMDSSEHESKQNNVNVAVRVRPFTKGESSAKNKRIASARDNHIVIVNPNVFNANPDHVAQAAVVANIPDWAKLFQFNHSIWSCGPLGAEEEECVSQEGVFRTIGLPIVRRALRGQSSVCFSYGQTAAGKTHSLFGSSEPSMNDSHGIIPRVFDAVICAVLNDCDVMDTKISMSMLEIYNEKIRDLLVLEKPRTHSVGEGDGTIVSSDALRVREHSVLGPYVVGATNAAIHSVEDMLRQLALGTSRRIRGPQAGRAHVVVTLELTPVWQKCDVDKTNKEKTMSKVDNTSPHQCVKVQIVDLAGSQRELNGSLGSKKSSFSDGNSNQAKYMTEKTEMKLIARSLATLGYIIRMLGTGTTPSVSLFSTPVKKLPYRDSILTWLLKDSLCAHNYVTVLAVISPASSCYEETISTLKYAERLCTLPTANSERSIIDGNSVDKSELNVSTGGISLDGMNVELYQPQSNSPGLTSSGAFPEVEKAVLPVVDAISPAAARHTIELLSSATADQVKCSLGAQEKGTLASRAFLMETVSDPQQRLAKMNENKPFTPVAVATVEENSTTVSSPKYAQISFMRDAYRELQGQMMALQMELDTARTDRDTLRVKLLHAGSGEERELFPPAAAPVPISSADTLNKAPSQTEEYLSKLVMRKEEIIEQLLSDLNDEVRKCELLEQNQASQLEQKRRELDEQLEESKRSTEETMVLLEAKYQEDCEEIKIKRLQLKSDFDSLKRDREKMKVDALAVAQKEAEMGDVRQGYKHSLTLMTQEKDAALQLCQTREKETIILTEEISSMKRKIRMFSEQSNTAEGFKNLMNMEREDEYFRAQELANMTSERNVLSLQVHENSAVISHLTAEVDIVTTRAAEKEEELLKLHHTLRQLLDPESVDVQSKNMDIGDVLSSVKESMLGTKDRLLELEAEKSRLGIELASVKQQLANNCADDLMYYKNMAKDFEKSEKHWKQIAQTATDRAPIYALSAPASNSIHQLEEVKKNNELQARDINNLTHEKLLLQQQITNAVAEANSAKQSLAASNESMKHELSSLWQTVEQLTALDASKDAAYGELVKKRDAIADEKEEALSNLRLARQDNSMLKKELAELDEELLEVLDNTEHLSPLKSVKGLRKQRLYDESLSLHLNTNGENHFNPHPKAAFTPAMDRNIPKVREPHVHTMYSNGRVDDFRPPPQKPESPDLAIHNPYTVGNDSTYGANGDHYPQHKLRLDTNLHSDNRFQTPSSTRPRRNTVASDSREGNRTVKQHMIDKFRNSDTERQLSEEGLEAQLFELSSFLERDKARLNSQQLRTQNRSDGRSRSETPLSEM